MLAFPNLGRKPERFDLSRHISCRIPGIGAEAPGSESGWQEKGVKQPGVFKVEAVGDGDIGGRGDEEWRVVGGRPAKRGQGRVREGAVPLGVKECAVEASEDGRVLVFSSVVEHEL
jgi:hypothetical protein